MVREEHYRKLENLYHSAPINQFYSPTLVVGKGTARIEAVANPDLFHAAHALHGSVYFKMLDDAAFFAVNSLVDDVFVLTASFNLYMLRPVSEGALVATGRAVHSTARTNIGEAELHDAAGLLVARGSGMFIRSRIRLTPEVGYSLASD